MFGVVGWLIGARGIAEAALRFLASPVGIIVVCLGIAWFANHKGHQSERRLCNAEVVAAEAAELKRQLAAAQKVAEDNAAALLDEQVVVDSLQEKVAKYEKDLEAAGGDLCRLTDDAIKRLQKRR